MVIQNNKWVYNDYHIGQIVEEKLYENGNPIYNIILINGNTSRKNAVYLHTSYTQDGHKISQSHINYKKDLTPLNPKMGEQRVMITYGTYGGIIEEVFMARVWTGFFSRKWIISKVNHFTEDGLLLNVESYIDPADFT